MQGLRQYPQPPEAHDRTRKQLLELLDAQDQEALEETEGYRQKYIKTANENGGGRRRNGYPLPRAFWTARLLEAK